MTSEQLQDKFQELNKTYFNGELPAYTLVAYRPLKSRIGLHNGAKREIQVDCTLEGDDAVACLLHEMVHAKVGDIHGHNKVFNAEAERVERMSGLNLRKYRQTAEQKKATAKQKKADEEKYYNYLMELATDPRRHRDKVQEEAAFARKHRLISADTYKAILAKNNE